VPTTRARTTTILGAILPHGVINVKARQPRASIQNKKRKARGGNLWLGLLVEAVLLQDITLTFLLIL
jgi:hypothetical protein